MEPFKRIIQQGLHKGYSDIHITGGHPMVFRHGGQLYFDKALQWGPADVDLLVRQLLDPGELATLRSRMSVDIARSIGQVRIRANIFNSLVPGGTYVCITTKSAYPALELREMLFAAGFERVDFYFEAFGWFAD